jgi:hypothetical protein
MTDDYTADHWRQAFRNVSGGGWTEHEPEYDLEAAILKVYMDVEQVDGNEGVVAAAIEAASVAWRSWEPDAFIDLARAFMCAYADLDMLKEQYIKENYPGTEVEWFKDDAPVWDGMVGEDELMVEANGAVYVFARPGSGQYAFLTRTT